MSNMRVKHVCVEHASHYIHDSQWSTYTCSTRMIDKYALHAWSTLTYFIRMFDIYMLHTHVEHVYVDHSYEACICRTCVWGMYLSNIV